MIYLDLDNAVQVYELTIEKSGGGANRILNKERLNSVLQFIRDDGYYPTFEEKLTHLFFSINKFHCFEDGNKRAAITLGAKFLLDNGFTFIVSKFIRTMENISSHVAAGSIDKQLLLEIITSIIYETDYSEELKLKLLNAIEGTGHSK
jgi:death-on-curing protein